MKTFTEQDLINALQEMMDMFLDSMDSYGMENSRTEMYFDWMIGAKEMVEALIEKPVNLRSDIRKVTVGLD